MRFRVKGPAIYLARAIGPGLLDNFSKGPTGRPFVFTANDRPFRPLQLRRLFPGRWPGLGKRMAPWAEITEKPRIKILHSVARNRSISRVGQVFNLPRDRHKTQETRAVVPETLGGHKPAPRVCYKNSTRLRLTLSRDARLYSNRNGLASRPRVKLCQQRC